MADCTTRIVKHLFTTKLQTLEKCCDVGCCQVAVNRFDVENDLLIRCSVVTANYLCEEM